MNEIKISRHTAYKDTITLPLFHHAKEALRFTRRVDQAHAIMLSETGVLSKSDTKAILQGIQAVDAALDLSTLESPEPFEDLFFYLEDRLIAQIGDAIGGNLHLARSRNDLEATVFRMALKEDMRLAIGGYLDQTAGLLAKAKSESATIVVAFTHGQPAQPTTFGHYLAAKVEADLRHAKRMFSAYDDIDASPLGAVAITTTGFSIDRQRVTALLGFKTTLENSYGCIASADYLTAAFQTLRLALIDIGRLSQDLALWSNGAVSQIRVSDDFCQISSVMPQKRNPLAIEYIRTLASLTSARCEAVTQAIHNTPFADMVDAEAPTQSAGAAAINDFIRVCELTKGLVAGLTVNNHAVRDLIATSAASATELADNFVRLEKLPFRQAHGITKALARVAETAGTTIQQIDTETANREFEDIVGRSLLNAWSDHIEALSPERSVYVREVFGGPGPGVLNNSLERYEVRLNELRAKLEQKIEAEEAAEKRLHEIVAALIGESPAEAMEETL